MPPWIQVGGLLYLGRQRFTVISIDPDRVVLQCSLGNRYGYTAAQMADFQQQPPDMPTQPGTLTVTLPMAGVIAETVQASLGTFQVLRNVEMGTPNVRVGQSVLVTQANGAVEPFTVLEISHNYQGGLTTYLAVLQEQRPELPSWMRTGVRLSLRGGGAAVAVINALMNNMVVIRDIEGRGEGMAAQILGGTAYSFTPQQIEELYQPEEVPTPSWLVVESRIVCTNPVRGINPTTVFQIESIDPLGGAFTVHSLEDPTRPICFNLREMEAYWAPYSSLSEVVRDRGSRQIVRSNLVTSTTIPAPPRWLSKGELIRPKFKVTRIFWVTALYLDRGVVRLQRVQRLNPLRVEAVWEEIPFEEVATTWEPLTLDGYPVSELTCPHCKELGSRQKGEKTPVYSVRTYNCENNHRWSFVDGGSHDGQAVVLTRFERDFDL